MHVSVSEGVCVCECASGCVGVFVCRCVCVCLCVWVRVRRDSSGLRHETGASESDERDWVARVTRGCGVLHEFDDVEAQR